jgi:hypothetical protein
VGDYSEGSTPKNEACDRSVLGGYLGGMSRRDARPEPDLFTLPERKTEPAPLLNRPVLLPDDLVSCLRQLVDADLERLQSAVVNEVTRRGPPLGVARATEQEVRPAAAPRPASSRRPRDNPSVPVALAVTAGKASAIRAAFRAGLKPAIIARQFGVPQSVVQQVLQGEARS